MVRSFPLVAFWIVLVAWAASAAEPSATSSPTAQTGPSWLSGRAFSNLYFPTQSLWEGVLQQQSAALWLQADPQLGSQPGGGASAHFVLTGAELGGSASGMAPTLQMGLREATLSYSSGGVEFKVGKMILPWGKSDAINPTDFFTAKDLTLFNPDEEVRRLGFMGASLNWVPLEGASPWAFTLVGSPTYTQTRMLFPKEAIPSTIAIQPLSSGSSALSLSSGQVAAKVAYFGSQWDASWVAYRGWNSLPELQLVDFSSSPLAVSAQNPLGLSINVNQRFRRVSALGGDAAVTTGKWVLRGEGATFWTENDTGTQLGSIPSHFDFVAGVERPFGEDFRVQAQVFTRYFPTLGAALPGTNGATSPATPSVSIPIQISSQIAATNALIQNFQDRVRPSGTLRVSYAREAARVEAELFLLFNFVGGDYFARPQFTYAWTDSLKSTFGLNYYAGPKDRPLGAMDAYSAVYTEWRAYF